MLFAKKKYKEKYLPLIRKAVERIENSKEFKDFLKFASTLHSYSFHNRLLIYMQKPDATYVAGIKTWNKLGRKVKKGEKGIVIFAPAFTKIVKTVRVKEKPKEKEETEEIMEADDVQEEVVEVEKVLTFFKPVHVFDVSQTYGKPLPEMPCQELRGNTKLYHIAKESIKKEGFKVEERKLMGNTDGYTDGKVIVINSKREEKHKLLTLLHEYAHAKVHFTSDAKDRRTKEVEAETAAFVMCQKFGIDSSKHSFSYIAWWKQTKDKEAFLKAVEKGIEIAEKLEENIKVNLQEIGEKFKKITI
ncbi:MAG TPA: DUF1738 domain-containing protein [Candidatus Aenigmarchaeota archaeon]|nr:DUF1738 domain-containing protein [Candidatus Aenigmarchaeota archaeon]